MSSNHEIAVEDRQRWNIATVFEMLKALSQRSRVDEVKDYGLNNVKQSCMRRVPQYMWSMLHTRADKASVQNQPLVKGEKH